MWLYILDIDFLLCNCITNSTLLFVHSLCVVLYNTDVNTSYNYEYLCVVTSVLFQRMIIYFLLITVVYRKCHKKCTVMIALLYIIYRFMKNNTICIAMLVVFFLVTNHYNIKYVMYWSLEGHDWRFVSTTLLQHCENVIVCHVRYDIEETSGQHCYCFQ